MRIIGTAAIAARSVTEELATALHEGRPVFVWSDGEDVTCVLGEAGDEASDVARMAGRFIGDSL